MTMGVENKVGDRKFVCFSPSKENVELCVGCIGARTCKYRVDLSSGTFEEISQKDSLNNKEE